MEKKPTDRKPVNKPETGKQNNKNNVKKQPANKPVPSPQNRKSKPINTNQKQQNPQKPQNYQKSKNSQKPQKTQTVQQSRQQSAQNIQKIPNSAQRRKDLHNNIPQADVDKMATEMLNKPRKNNNSTKAKKDYTKPLVPAKAPISPYKRRLKRILFYTATLVILIAICAVLSLTVFFQIDNIEVEGETRYNTEDIIASSCINKGDNLILCNTSTGEEQIEKDFPYIESVDIQKKLFNNIIIYVTEAKPASIIESDGQYVVMSESGKILEVNDEKKYDVPTILGAQLKSVKLSSNVKFKDENINKYVEEIMQAVNDNNIKNIETIDISNLTKIALIKDNGFKIIIGTPENIDYKLKTAKAIMDKSVSDTDVGTLDVSLASADGGKSYLSSAVESSMPDKQQSSEASSQKNNKDSSDESSKNSSDTSSENSEEPSEESIEETSVEPSE